MRHLSPKRRVRQLVLASLFVLLATVLSSPLWLPPAFRSLTAQAGLRYARLEQTADGALRFHEVFWSNGPVSFAARAVSLPGPGEWPQAWRLPEAGQGTPVAASDWRLTVQSPPQSRLASVPAVYSNVQQVLQVGNLVRRWLPFASLDKGTVHVGQVEFPVDSITLTNGELRAAFQDPLLRRSTRLRARFSGSPRAQAEIHSDSLDLHSRIELLRQTNSVRVGAMVTWRSNDLRLQATFGRTGVLPRAAHLVAEHLRLPAAELGLSPYDTITGRIQGSWSNSAFALIADLFGAPPEKATLLPPLTCRLAAQGNTNAAHIQMLQLASPWANLRLSEPIEVEFAQPGWLKTPAGVALSGDLSRQPWLPLKGGVSLDAHVRPGSRRIPEISFDLRATNFAVVSLSNLPPAKLEAAGSLEWPMLAIRHATLSLADGTVARGEGGIDLAALAVEQARLSVRGDSPAAWGPSNFVWQTFGLEASACGPFTNMSHAGELRVSHLQMHRVQPLDVNANWSGTGLDFTNAFVNVKAPGGAAQIAGAADFSDSSKQFHLQTFSFDTGKAGSHYMLARPVTGFFQLSAPWALALSPLEWSSGRSSVYLAARVEKELAQGEFQADIINLDFDDFRSVLPPQLSGISVQRLEAAGGWTNGPLVFKAALAAQVRTNPIPASAVALLPVFPVQINAQLKAEPNHAVVNRFSITGPSAPLMEAQGVIPARLRFSKNGPLPEPIPGPLNLSTEISSASALWPIVEKRLGWRVDEPALYLTASGSWDRPEARVSLRARQLAPPPGRGPLPPLTHLQAEVLLDASAATVTNLQLLVGEQPVQFAARLPLDRGLSSLAGLPPLQIAEQLTATMRIPDASLASLSQFYTNLAPQGYLDANFNLEPGLKLSGKLDVRNARTRPLPNLGPIRDVTMQLKIDNSRVELRNVTGAIGAAPVVVTGFLDFPFTGQSSGLVPVGELNISGTNVPLSRSPDAIIRSDLDVTVTLTNGAPPLLHGTANLRNSIVLSDLGALVSTKVATPKRRPPYFSVETPPFADWRLGVKVVGDQFLRARTPIFRGIASVNMELGGTLREPMAVGEATINSGIIRFPFASFRVQQGLITLRSDNPYQPRLSLNAESTQFGYDLRMEVRGRAQEPIVQFTSNLPLTSEQVLLMISAGELPRDEMVLSNQQRAQTMALFLGRDLLARLGYGDEAEQRLSVYSGEQISEQGTPTYRLEYKLTDRWMLTGEYDRFDDFNAGLRWRVFSK